MPPSEAELAAAAVAAEPARQLRAFTGWVGAGRELTQTGRVRLSDARELVELLATGDEIDRAGAGPRIASSAELPGLTLAVEWAKASRLVRVTGRRLVSVKKNAALLDRPLELWARMFEAFPQLGAAVCPPGWAESLMRRHFDEAIGVVLREMHARSGTVELSLASAQAWETVTSGYVLDGTDEQQARWRAMNDRDLRSALNVLEQLGAVRQGAGSATLTELGLWAMRRASGWPAPGEDVFQIKISLAGVSGPPVWRRILVPATIRLDRMHEAIQAVMGWENYHMHVFSHGPVEYAVPDRELGYRDERTATVHDLVDGEGDRIHYTYDFGDDWNHVITVEKVLCAEPGRCYPECVAGKGACPPEDCGGVWGYRHLREVLAEPADEEHEEMREWLGLEHGSDFDPAAFDADEANYRLAIAA